MEKDEIIMLIYSLLYDCNQQELEELYSELFGKLYVEGRFASS